MPADLLTRLTAELASHGMALRGGFVPGRDDGVPALAPGRAARTLLMVGNVGGAMWPAFVASQPGDSATETDGNPMDAWTRQVIDRLAGAFGAKPLYPFSGPPYFPFQRWAQRAEPVHPSPLMIFIHPVYGLWHAYRAALVFAEDIPLPPVAAIPAPCDTCAGRPCLTACPVNAFTGTGFDDMACARHVAGPDGIECRERGCLARRACPVGTDHLYPPPQMAFHMSAFLAPRRVQSKRVWARQEWD